MSRAGISHANTTAAASTTGETATTRSWRSARRADNLYLNVINPLPLFRSALRREELAHVGCAGCRAGEHVHPQPFQDQPQRALVLIQRGGLIAGLRLRTDGHPYDPTAPVGIVAARLVEHDDEQPVLLEHRALDQRADVVLEPGIRRAQRAIVRVVAQIRHDVREMGERTVRPIRRELRERYVVTRLYRVVRHLREQR